MKTRPLGSSDIQASAVAFGTWALGGWQWGGTERNEATKSIHAAIDIGMNFMDTAPVYGFGLSEELVGEAIHDRRDRVVLATKLGLVWHTDGVFFFESTDPNTGTAHRINRNLKPEIIRFEIEQSLRRLRTDYIDLYQTHWQDKDTPIEDTMAELMKLKGEGKIRAIGVSNATPAQVDTYRTIGPIDSDQEAYSMLRPEREDDLLPYCADNGLAFLAYSPLGQGLLTGKIGPERTFPSTDLRSGKPAFSAENREKVASMLAKFQPIADAHSCTLAQLAIAWTIHQHGCSHALVGARTVAQAEENAVGGEIDLSESDLATMNSAIRSYRTE